MPAKSIILIIDDDTNLLRTLSDILKVKGYETLTAKDGKGGLDGLQAGIILKNDPKTRHIKIIAITSFAMKGDRDRIMEAGVNDYISKPIDTRGLPKILDLHLGTGKEQQ